MRRTMECFNVDISVFEIPQYSTFEMTFYGYILRFVRIGVLNL